jgi:cytochrome c553
VDGVQYIAVAVGGHTLLSDSVANQLHAATRAGGNALYVFRLAPKDPDLTPLKVAADDDGNGSVPYLKTDTASGKIYYLAKCAACHGEGFKGAGHVPALTGCGFQARWRGKTLQEMFRLIAVSMPPGATIPLDSQTNANILSYWANAHKAHDSLTNDTGAWSNADVSSIEGICNEAP